MEAARYSVYKLTITITNILRIFSIARFVVLVTDPAYLNQIKQSDVHVLKLIETVARRSLFTNKINF